MPDKLIWTALADLGDRLRTDPKLAEKFASDPGSVLAAEDLDVEMPRVGAQGSQRLSEVLESLSVPQRRAALEALGSIGQSGMIPDPGQVMINANANVNVNINANANTNVNVNIEVNVNGRALQDPGALVTKVDVAGLQLANDLTSRFGNMQLSEARQRALFKLALTDPSLVQDATGNARRGAISFRGTTVEVEGRLEGENLIVTGAKLRS